MIDEREVWLDTFKSIINSPNSIGRKSGEEGITVAEAIQFANDAASAFGGRFNPNPLENFWVGMTKSPGVCVFSLHFPNGMVYHLSGRDVEILLQVFARENLCKAGGG